MNLIAAVDKNWAIGYQNKLLTSIPEDMKFFRQTTTGKVVVMGRKTLESFPGKKPLKNRTNIVLTKNPSYQAEGAIVVHKRNGRSRRRVRSTPALTLSISFSFTRKTRKKRAAPG